MEKGYQRIKLIDNLFKKFYQVDMTASRKYGGTGLGLAICKEIIDAHGGKIWANNNKEEKGASFFFSLPLMSESDDERIQIIRPQDMKL